MPSSAASLSIHVHNTLHVLHHSTLPLAAVQRRARSSEMASSPNEPGVCVAADAAKTKRRRVETAGALQHEGECHHDAAPASTAAGDQPLVSIVVPVHNAAPWLDECLGSILTQTYPAARMEVSSALPLRQPPFVASWGLMFLRLLVSDAPASDGARLSTLARAVCCAGQHLRRRFDRRLGGDHRALE